MSGTEIEVKGLDLSRYDGCTTEEWELHEWSILAKNERKTHIASADQNWLPHSEKTANARLIADAPKLLSEVKGLRKKCADLEATNAEISKMLEDATAEIDRYRAAWLRLMPKE